MLRLKYKHRCNIILFESSLKQQLKFQIMKTSLYLCKVSVFTVLLLFAHIHVFGTGKIAAQLKDNQTLVVDFFHTDTVLIIVPEACELRDRKSVV